MMRRPPMSTHTDTRFPDTTRFRSPPGQGHALLHPHLRDLTPEECRTLLSTHGVGRIAVTTPDGRPAIIPVNYEIVDDDIVFRTASSEENPSELQSLMRISYAVFCLKKKKQHTPTQPNYT